MGDWASMDGHKCVCVCIPFTKSVGTFVRIIGRFSRLTIYICESSRFHLHSFKSRCLNSSIHLTSTESNAFIVAKWNTPNTRRKLRCALALARACTLESCCIMKMPNRERRKKNVICILCPSKSVRLSLRRIYSFFFSLFSSFLRSVSFFSVLKSLWCGFFCFALHSMALACISDTVFTTSFLAIQEALNEHRDEMHHPSANALWADVLHKIRRDNKVFQFV